MIKSKSCWNGLASLIMLAIALLGINPTNAQIVIGSGAHFIEAGTVHVVLDGDIINDGKLSYIFGGTTAFNGSSKQYISGMAVDSVSFYNITLNNPQGLSLGTNVTVNNAVKFVNGSIYMNGYNVISQSADPFEGNNDSTSFFVSNGLGMLFRNQNDTAVLLFPIGTATGKNNYTPASIQNTGTADNYGMRVMDNVYDNYDGTGNPSNQNTGTNFVKKSWILYEQTIGGSDLSASLYWRAVHEGNTFDRSSSGVFYFDNVWDRNVSMRASDGSNPYWQSRTFGNNKNYLPLTVGNQSALPIELIRFEVTQGEKGAMLNWQTTSEVDNDHFEVEVSQDGFYFKSIGEVSGHRNSNTWNNYDFIDENYANYNTPVTYYRLKQIDFNGIFEYTAVKNLNKTSKGDLSLESLTLSPNPVADFIYLAITAEVEEEIHCTLINTQGQEVVSSTFRINKGANTLPLDLQSISPGIYTVIIKSTNGLMTRKIVKA